MDEKPLSVALGHLLELTLPGWRILVLLVVIALLSWLSGSKTTTPWLLHKAVVLLIAILIVRALARTFLNQW
jgi:hypothetical protein